MGFFDTLSRVASKEKDNYKSKVNSSLNDQERKIDRYEREHGSNSKTEAARDRINSQRDKLDKW